MILLDTSVLSALMRANPDEKVVQWLDRQPRSSVWTTSVSVLEVRFGLAILPIGKRRTALQAAFVRMITIGLENRVAAFDHAAAEQAAQLMAEHKAKGCPGDLRDTMIAGIALASNATLATGNVRHFADLHCPVVDPWNL